MIDTLRSHPLEAQPEGRPEILLLGNKEWGLPLPPDEIRKEISLIYGKYGSDRGEYNPKEDMLCGDISDDISDFLLSKGIPAQTVRRNYEFWDSDGTLLSEEYGHAYAQSDSEGLHHIIDATYLQFMKAEEKDKLPDVLMISYRSKRELLDVLDSLPFETPAMTKPLYMGFIDSPMVLEGVEVVETSDTVCKVILDGTD